MLSAWLHTEGCRYETAADARSGLAALAAREYDLLICDVHLPDFDGLELVKAIDDRNRGLPVIFLTGQPSLETAMRSVRLRVVAYLVKPPNLDELRALLHREVPAHRQRRIVAASRLRLHEWDRELVRIEAGLDTPSGTGAVDYLQATVRQLALILSELDRSVTLVAADRSARGRLDEIDLVAAVRKAVQVLERTRFNFKSKDLGDLRKDLESLLQRYAVGDQAGENSSSPPTSGR